MELALMVMPRQHCPVCGNRPHVFRDRQRDLELSQLRAKLVLAKETLDNIANHRVPPVNASVHAATALRMIGEI